MNPAAPNGPAALDLVLLAPQIAPAAVEAFAAALPAQRVERAAAAARLYGVSGGAESRALAAALAAHWKCDAAFVPSRLRRADIRLLVMDMDSTLITIECIDELAALAGQGAAVAAITAAAMQGSRGDYAASLRQRCALLAGAPAALFERVRTERLRYSPGARALLAAARASGWHSLLVSGGFTQFALGVQEDLGIDTVCANTLVVNDGRITGAVLGSSADGGAIVDAQGKLRALERQCARLGCTPAQALAVGDGANDLLMLGAAGLSVAWRAKAVVRARAGAALDYAGLDALALLFADAW